MGSIFQCHHRFERFRKVEYSGCDLFRVGYHEYDGCESSRAKSDRKELTSIALPRFEVGFGREWISVRTTNGIPSDSKQLDGLDLQEVRRGMHLCEFRTHAPSSEVKPA
jgi:hypothetical protein